MSITEVLTSRPTSRSAPLAACLALLLAGASACGTDGGPSASANTVDHPRAATSLELATSAKGNQDAYLQHLQTEADVAAVHGFGDDRRQSGAQSGRGQTSTGRHPAGYDKALTAER